MQLKLIFKYLNRKNENDLEKIRQTKLILLFKRFP